ncbi:MAG: DsrE family protein [Thermoplasmata archaeon]|nr:DsrE family protein [Thermoplasmata archaeon]
MAMKKKILIAMMHGTYGHHDDCYGAIQLANAIVAKGGEVTLFLRSDGVFFAMKGQDPTDLGLPNNLDEISDFLELGGIIKVDSNALASRGLEPGDLIEEAEIMESSLAIELIEQHEFCLTF